MAVLPCWPLPQFEVTANESLRRFPRPPSSASATYNRQRGTIRLNVPTVAALRKRSVILDPRPLAPHRISKNMPGLVAAPCLQAASEPEPASSIEVTDWSPENARIASEPTPRGPPASYSSQEPAPSGSRRGSATQRSTSADSSPTSTISTLDSALTGSSPSSSPESPTSSLPMNSFDGKASHETVVESPMSTEHALISPPPGSEGTESAGKRPRNVRNLSINTKGISTRPATTASLINAKSGPTVATAGAAVVPARMVPSASLINSPPPLERALSEPSSPSFIVPQAQPRKRRSKLGLSIATPDASSTNGLIPETPGFAPAWRSGGSGAPALKRFSALKSAERLPYSPSGGPPSGMSFPAHGGHGRERSLPTPAFAPMGGMSLPPLGGPVERSPAQSFSGPGPTSGPTSGSSSVGLRPALTLASNRSFEGGSASSVIHHTVEHTVESPTHELPLSREVKSPSYPNGPACIYSPSVYLYHQPTAAEAREFDVVVNVAKEVPNPFTEESERLEEVKTARGYTDVSIQCDLLSAPPLVPFSWESKDEEPETPKASSPSRGKAMPEYIHLPWEHNSHVFEEWLEICELIDSRVKQGKKVLIHCQLGVSRSASLIVAYGLYKNPGQSPDEAREAAKTRSKWIDLNMHFMYELGDFKKILLRKFPDIYTVGRAIAPPPLARHKTESFLPTNTLSNINTSLPREPEGRRASSIEARAKLRDEGNEQDVPSSAPVSKMWTAEESAAKNADLYAAAQNKMAFDTIPEHSPPLPMERDKKQGGEGSDPAMPVHVAASPAPTSAHPAGTHTMVPKAPRTVPTLAAPSPPQRSTAGSTSSIAIQPTPFTNPTPTSSPAPSTTTTTTTIPLTSTPLTNISHSRHSSSTKASLHSREPSVPTMTANIHNPAQDLPNLSTLRFSRQDPPDSPPPLPGRMLRPMPSLPGGFTSMRRPKLDLQIQPTPPGSDTSSIAPPAANQVATEAVDGKASVPPFLPPLDLGSGTLMSPRTTAFVGVPFKRNSMAGDLAGVDWENAGLKSPGAPPAGGFEAMLKREEERRDQRQREARGANASDPRSPPVRAPGEVTMRSIDDVL